MLKPSLLSASMIVAAFGLAACGSSDTPQQTTTTVVTPQPPVNVTLVGLNDFHGSLQTPGGNTLVADPANASGTRVSTGGAAYLSTLIKNIRTQNPNTLVVGAGDMLGASPLISSLFHDEPTIDALNEMGLDVTSVGTHEFDRGVTELKRLQSGGCFPRSTDGSRGVIGVDTCLNSGSFSGAKFQYLSANVIDTASNKTLFEPYTIRTVAGEKIAFVGVILKDTAAAVTPGRVTGLTFKDEVDTVNGLVPDLVKQGVSAIVVLIHQGGTTTATTINDKSCPGISGDIVSITDRFDARIDVVVSGRSHSEYNCTRPDGKILTQAGFNGRVVSKIDLKISPDTHRVTSKTAENLPVVNDLPIKDASGNVIALPAGLTALAKDAKVDAIITRFTGLLPTMTGQVIGTLQTAIDRNINSAGESKMGDLLADIYLNSTSGPNYGDKAAQIAFINVGAIRAGLNNTATTFNDLFATMPFGNNVVTMDLTGQQIIQALEQQWEAPQPAGGRILQVSSGFSYTWDASKSEGASAGTGARVLTGSVKLNGVALDMSKTYRVTINNFLATGGDNFAVFKAGKNVQSGEIDIDAGVAYFRSKGTIATPTQDRINRIN